MGKKKKAEFYAKHPYCSFCGGKNAATTVDHVPPRACFPDGYWPEEFEFPACEACNQATTEADQIFGFYTMLLDFNENNRTPADRVKLHKLQIGLENNYPDALPNTANNRLVASTGPSITRLALEISMPSAFRTAAATIANKLTHALYYRERGAALTNTHLLRSEWYQPQRAGMQSLTDLFTGLLPEQMIGMRSNVKQYGERFAYRFGVKEEDDFFMYAAQFGRGVILWGIVLGPQLSVEDLQEPLRSGPWRQGADHPQETVETSL